MFFVMDLLAFKKLSYCKTADTLPSQAFSAQLCHGCWSSQLFCIPHHADGIFSPVFMTKPIILGLIIQVRTTCVCASCPICGFRNLKSNALVLPFSKILLSCSDLRCLWEWFWSGSDHLVLKRNVLQVNHFEPGTKLSPWEIHRPVWMEQGNKSKCCSFFFFFFCGIRTSFLCPAKSPGPSLLLWLASRITSMFLHAG